MSLPSFPNLPSRNAPRAHMDVVVGEEGPERRPKAHVDAHPWQPLQLPHHLLCTPPQPDPQVSKRKGPPSPPSPPVSPASSPSIASAGRTPGGEGVEGTAAVSSIRYTCLYCAANARFGSCNRQPTTDHQLITPSSLSVSLCASVPVSNPLFAALSPFLSRRSATRPCGHTPRWRTPLCDGRP